jgi:hypothetical protein
MTTTNETTGPVVSEYPEHEKLSAVAGESEIIGTFLEESGYILAEYHDVEGFAEARLSPVQKSIEQILADYFHIDLPALGHEKVRILDGMRELNNRGAGAAAADGSDDEEKG